MTRIFQIKDGTVCSEWVGEGPPPVPPDNSWTFVDVTSRPELTIFHGYDESTKEFTSPLPPPDHGERMDPREFMLTFTPEERKAMRAAAASDPDVQDALAILEMPVPIMTRAPSTLTLLTVLKDKRLIKSVEIKRADTAEVAVLDAEESR